LPLAIPFTSLTWSAPPWALRMFYWCQIVTGWLLIGALIAVLSRVMKDE